VKNGIYKIEFETILGAGTGAVELKDGHVFGSDTAILYVGEYELIGNTFQAEVRVRQHSPGSSVLGLPNATLRIVGFFDPALDSFEFAGSSPDVPNVNIKIRLKRLQIS
jgi:hypothetical protein